MYFNIIICGGGLGGLGAAIALRLKGHQVTVLEGATQLAEVGAGIQIPPNSSRVLAHYGVYDEIIKLVVWPKSIQFRRYSSGDVIGRTPLDPTMKEEYGFPYFLIHRADYQKCLYDYAVKLGVEVRLGTYVHKVVEESAMVTLADGTAMTADIVIGADGIRSRVREAVLQGQVVEAADSSNCAYRATVPREAMMADPEVAHLMSDVNSNCWIGHQRHIMAYPIRGGELYNLVMSHPGKAAVGRWNEPGNLDEMREHYKHFDPVIRKVVGKVQSCLKWKLADLPKLDRWVSDSGRVVIIGDAAHAMVPYLAQGAATAIEDGAALAECISYAEDTSMIPAVLRAFQDLRKARCEIIKEGSLSNGDIWHMPDGPEQQQRDLDMQNTLVGKKEAASTESAVKNPNRWSDKDFQPWLFGHDAVEEAKKFLDQRFGSVKSQPEQARL